MKSQKATLTNAEWAAVKPLLADSQGVNDRRIVAGIRWVLKSGEGWRNIPDVVGTTRWTTYYNRYNNWLKDGLWPKIQRAINTAGVRPAQRTPKRKPATVRVARRAKTARRPAAVKTAARKRKAA